MMADTTTQINPKPRLMSITPLNPRT